MNRKKETDREEVQKALARIDRETSISNALIENRTFNLFNLTESNRDAIVAEVEKNYRPGMGNLSLSREKYIEIAETNIVHEFIEAAAEISNRKSRTGALAIGISMAGLGAVAFGFTSLPLFAASLAGIAGGIDYKIKAHQKYERLRDHSEACGQYDAKAKGNKAVYKRAQKRIGRIISGKRKLAFT
ncbi:MAG: hypothetical protein PHE27_05715 [Alphaproteobacteria bacterium]|nr:hypothetical protein [Alphaproteobacteria bacterium]